MSNISKEETKQKVKVRKLMIPQVGGNDRRLTIVLPVASERIIAEYLRWQRFKASNVVVPAKTRGEVSYSTRKIRPQKRTGKPTLGGRGSPMLIGGGVAHGPKKRVMSIDMNKKVRMKAKFGSLLRAEGRLKHDDTLDLTFSKTKDLLSWIASHGLEKKRVLYLTETKVECKAHTNLFKFNYLPFYALNVRDVLKAEIIIIRSALTKLIRWGQ